jgi:beta-glucosidase
MRWTWRGYPGVKPLPASLEAAVNNESWAVDWWQDRHEEKLKTKDQLKDIDIVMLGDSITHNWEKDGKPVFDSEFKNYKVLNLGFSGDRTEHVLWRLRNGAVGGIRPRVVMLLIGTNNTGHREESPTETASGIAAIISELRTRVPGAKILLQAIFPRDRLASGKLRKQNDAVNAIIKDFADGETVVFADINDAFLDQQRRLSKKIMPDFLHPNRQGYQKWADAILPALKRLLE